MSVLAREAIIAEVRCPLREKKISVERKQSALRAIEHIV